jgi:hypothetical protein
MKLLKILLRKLGQKDIIISLSVFHMVYFLFENLAADYTRL